MVNVLEALYGATAASAVIAIYLWIRTYKTSEPDRWRRRARIWTGLTVVSAVAAVFLYFYIAPTP